MLKIDVLDLVPCQFTPLNRLKDGQLKEQLTALYNSPDLPQRVLASLLNHCYTSRTHALMFTIRYAQEAIETDVNQSFKFSVTSKQYKRLGRWFLDDVGFLQTNVEEKKANPKLAALLRLCDQWQDMIGITEEEKVAVRRLVEEVKTKW